MNIHCISYKNIGPFIDQTVSVVFHAGSYLIKAPVGTGKSFLFFDGPLFALYKYSTRQMLSRNASQGQIRCIFSHNNTVWCIERTISATKAGNDSTKSRLLSFHDNEIDIEAQLSSYDTLVWGTDICAGFLGVCDEVSFTNQRELDGALNDLLPPREVTSSVYLMMQESDHIFELPAGQRINVFKHLFGMLGIDDAKTVLSDRKKEVQGMLSLLDDSQQEKTVLNRAIQQIRDAVQYVRASEIYQHSEGFQTIWNRCESITLLRDSSLLGDSVGLDGLQTEADALEKLQESVKQLQGLQQEGIRIASERTSHEQSQQQLTKQTALFEEKISTTQQKITHLETLLANDQGGQHQALLQQKEKLQDEIKAIESQWSSSPFEKLGESVTSLNEAVACITGRIDAGKSTAQSLQLQQERIDRYQKIVTDYHTTIAELEKQRSMMDQQYEEQMRFHCDKIEGDCPYVEMIKGAAGRSLQQQRTLVEQKLHQEKERFINEKTQEHLATAQSSHDTLLKQQEQLRTNLQLVERKSLITLHEQTHQLQQSLETVNKGLLSLQDEQNKRNQHEKDLAGVRAELLIYQQNRDDLSQQNQQLTEKVTQLDTQRNSGMYDQLDGLISQIQTIIQSYQRIDELLQEYLHKKEKKHTLELELKRIKSLHTIFSKELLVVVLQDFLPQLQEVINAYLAQVVSYEVRFAMPESVDSTLELDISIIDEHGERGVKSLSGGQRALLKICWILAVSSLMRSKFLFLDETITSLDASAIGRVGVLLKQFVEQTTIKLYVVTHAQQIQEMDLWTKTIDVVSYRNQQENQ